MGPTTLLANHQMSDQIKDNISLNVYMRKEVVIMIMMMMVLVMMMMTQDCIVSP